MKKNATPLDVANEEIKSLKKQIETQKTTIAVLEAEREVFRSFLCNEHKLQFKLVGSSSYYPPQAVIQRILSDVIPYVTPFKLWK